MLNTEKLLYILPDLTYVADLLPAKKEHTFSIQSFRQINGEFIDDNEFIANNIEKLFTKLDKDEFHLILPDFLFTNTIVNIKETDKEAIEKEIKEKILPGMDLKDSTHEIETAILTSFKGTSKVQISAIEKSLLAPLRLSSEKSKVKIKAISPISWVIKSIISLEPSISILQIGTNLYSSQHYIGVDQSNSFPVSEYKSIIETIKTLKGAEPSIQTIYLSSSQLVEENLKESLSDTLPIQQLASFKDDDSQMPSYVKYIIEASMRTLSIIDFPVPRFKIGKATEEDKKAPAVVAEVIEEKEEETKISSKEPAPTDLPTPSAVPAAVTSTVAEIKEVTPMPEETKKEEVKETKVTIEEPSKEEIEEVKKVTEEKVVEAIEVKDEPVEEKEKVVEAKVTIEKPAKEEIEEVKKVTEEKVVEAIEVKDEPVEEKAVEEEPKKEDVNLSQFAGKDTENDSDLDTDSKAIATKTKDTPNITKSKKVIKNSSGVNNMLKMVFITLAVFFITIAIGIGVGLGLLKMSDSTPAEETPVVVTEATPTPTATPEATPAIEIDKEALSIKVVNATTKAGYAGTVKKDIVADGIEDVDAGNANGDYESTDLVLMDEENDALKEILEEATGLTLEYSEGQAIEDPDLDYDAVIILAK